MKTTRSNTKPYGVISCSFKGLKSCTNHLGYVIIMNNPKVFMAYNKDLFLAYATCPFAFELAEGSALHFLTHYSG